MVHNIAQTRGASPPLHVRVPAPRADMDGFKLLEVVGLEMDLPVIMISGNDDTQTVRGLLVACWRHIRRHMPFGSRPPCPWCAHAHTGCIGCGGVRWHCMQEGREHTQPPSSSGAPHQGRRDRWRDRCHRVPHALQPASPCSGWPAHHAPPRRPRTPHMRAWRSLALPCRGTTPALLLQTLKHPRWWPGTHPGCGRPPLLLDHMLEVPPLLA